MFHFDVNEEHEISVLFNAAHADDCHSTTVDDALCITYTEHPHVVSCFCSATMLNAKAKTVN